MTVPANEAPSEAPPDTVPVGIADLPLVCPRPGEPLWARHPRVVLDVLTEGHVACPYCGTRYVFTGERPSGHD